VVDEPFGPKPRVDAEVVQDVDRSVLENPGTYPCLDVLAWPVLEHDGVDPLGAQKLSEHETSWSGTDDSDLRPHHGVRLLVS
jgi:hypothetical protein